MGLSDKEYARLRKSAAGRRIDAVLRRDGSWSVTIDGRSTKLSADIADRLSEDMALLLDGQTSGAGNSYMRTVYRLAELLGYEVIEVVKPTDAIDGGVN